MNDAESVDEILRPMTIQIKAFEQYCPVVLFFILYKVVLTFESVNEILIIEQYLLNSNHLNGYTLGFHPQTQKLEPPGTAFSFLEF